MADIMAFPAAGSLAAVTAANVRAEAARRGLSQTDVARLLGIAQSGVSARYRVAAPFTLHELEVLAAAFGLEATDLVRRPRQDSNLQPTDLVSADDTLARVIDLATRRNLPDDDADCA